MLWEILEARDSARVNRINMGHAAGGRSMEGTVTDLGDDADWAPPGAGDRPMMLGKDTASRGGFTLSCSSAVTDERIWLMGMG